MPDEMYKIAIHAPGEGRVEQQIVGYAENNSRINILPREYYAQWLSRNFPNATELEGALRILEAGPNGENLDIRASEFPFTLADWPSLDPRSCISVLAKID